MTRDTQYVLSSRDKTERALDDALQMAVGEQAQDLGDDDDELIELAAGRLELAGTASSTPR